MSRHTLSVALVLAIGVRSSSAAPVISKSTEGNPKLRSINVLAFAPDGVLLVGDGAGGSVVAIETGDTSSAPPFTKPIENFGAKIAGRLGAKPDGVEIVDLAVNPASGRVYVAVRRQADKRYVIVTVDGEGIEDFDLDAVKYARLPLGDATSKISVVTDVAWADDRLVAAARSNDSFASRIFSATTPLIDGKTGGTVGAETYHVSHRRWETRAPMSVLIPFREKDRTYVVGAFSCTPVVKFPIDAVQADGKVKGISVLELGSGNRPIDMFAYEKDGKPYVLANTFRFHHARRPFGPSPYWAVRFEQSVLAEDEDVNEKALRRLKGNEPATDRVTMVEAFHGVMQMDKLGNDRAVVLRKTKDGVDLQVLPLP